MAVDVAHYEDFCLTTDEVLASIGEALSAGTPLSLSRLGHAEMAVLSHRLSPRDWPMQRFIAYSGVRRFEPSTVRRLVAAYTAVDIVGLVPGRGHPDGPRTKQLLRAFHIQPKQVCDAWVTHRLAERDSFSHLLSQTRLILVGRRAEEASSILAGRGIVPVAVYSLEGMESLDATLAAIERGPRMELVLLAAGVPAAVAAPELAGRTGCVAVDFGHALDLLIDGAGFDYPKLEKSWWLGQGGGDRRPGRAKAPGSPGRRGRRPRLRRRASRSLRAKKP